MTPNRPYPPSSTPITPIDDEARKELMATIAASRDLGPEMDHTLAERYLERLSQRQARDAQRQSRRTRMPADLRRLWPLALIPVFLAALGALMVAGVVLLALHGGLPAGGHEFFQQHASNQYGQPDGGRPDGGGGFFSLFSLLFWILPVLFLIRLARRRAAGRVVGSNRGSTGVGDSRHAATLPAESLPTARFDSPYGAYEPYAPFEEFAPYQPYAPATAATAPSATSAPLPASTTIITETPPPVTPQPPALVAPSDDLDGMAHDAPVDVANDGMDDDVEVSDQASAGPASEIGRSPVPPTRPLSNPAG